MKPETLELVENLIRTGRLAEAQRELKAIKPGRLSRPDRLSLAQLCRRAGLVGLGLKSLSAIIHAESSENSMDVGPLPAERAEYGMLLLRYGLNHEASEWLESVDASDFSDILLYRAYAALGRRDSETALSNLDTYIATETRTYQRLVGQVNRAATICRQERWADALEAIEPLLIRTREHGHLRLYGNCLELKAQVLALGSSDFTRARECLALASAEFRSSPGDAFAVKKWSYIFDALETKNVAPLEQLRMDAQRQNDWETLRLADFFHLRIEFDKRLFQKLLNGTPWLQARRFYAKSFGQKMRDDRPSLWGDEAGEVLDLRTGAIVFGKAEGAQVIRETEDWVDGGRTQLLIRALIIDQYVPQRIPVLFSEVFPGEKFDVFHSTGRMHQVLRRARRWIAQNSLPLVIIEKDGTYQLMKSDATRQFGIKLPPRIMPMGGYSTDFEKLRRQLPDDRLVTAQGVRTQLQMSKTTALRFLRWAVESGCLIREGTNNRTTYKWGMAEKPKFDEQTAS